MTGLVANPHAMNIHTVLWTTAMINSSSFDPEFGGETYPSPSPNFQEALDCNYFVNQGMTYFWWKGTGGGVDFFSPDATAWMHRQEDNALSTGIDGFKLDFAENYVGGATVHDAMFDTASGMVSRQTYSERYYQYFLAYGRAKNGPEFMTMTRAWDASYGFPWRLYAKKENSPISWMGDQRRDYSGLAKALNEELVSAAAGYVAPGADIAMASGSDLGDGIPLMRS